MRLIVIEPIKCKCTIGLFSEMLSNYFTEYLHEISESGTTDL